MFLDAPARPSAQAFSALPEYLRTPRGSVVNLKDYGPALGRRFRAQALGRHALLRPRRQHLIREHVRFADLFASWIEAEPGWEPRRAASVLRRVLSAGGSDEENEALLEPRERER